MIFLLPRNFSPAFGFIRHKQLGEPLSPTHPQRPSQNEISPDDLTSSEATPSFETLGVFLLNPHPGEKGG